MKTYKLNENLFLVDGYYYCTNDDEIKELDLIIFPKTNWLGYCRTISGAALFGSKSKNINYENIDVNFVDCKKIEFTTNPNIGLPIIVFKSKEDEALLLANTIKQEDDFSKGRWYGIIQGFNSAKENYLWTDEDMIGFVDFVIVYYPNQWKAYKDKNRNGFYTTQELLNIYTQSKEKLIESFEVEMVYLGKHKDWFNPKWHPKINPNNTITAVNIKYK